MCNFAAEKVKTMRMDVKNIAESAKITAEKFGSLDMNV